jgi:glycosyltransferase 2 family protein
VRAYLLGRKTGLRKTTILATIVIEKAFDGIALLLIFLFSLIILPAATTRASGVSPDTLAGLAGVALLVAIGGLLLFYKFSDKIARFVARMFDVLPLPRRFERLLVRLIETFAGGMHIFKTPRPLIVAGVISLVVWLVVGLMFLTALLSFQAAFPTELTGWAGLLFMTGLVNLGLLVPALPGNVGTYEALCIAAMAVFGVDKELAVAFALIFHVGQLVVTLAVGVVAFWAQNLSFSEIGPVEQKAEQEAEETLEEIEEQETADGGRWTMDSGKTVAENVKRKT